MKNKNVGNPGTVREKGITLVALVITIIILLILSGITISQLLGNGLLERVKEAKEISTKAQIKEEIQLELMGIITEYTSKNETITNTIIKDELENKLSKIEVSDDLTGTYKNYDYEIDEEYNVHIIGKENKSMKVKVNSTIGTSYIIINVEASSSNGDIIQYDYIIDGITYTSTEAVYKVENLEPESNHTIKVISIDEKENKKETRTYNVKTESRTYIYKEGNEYEEITNGWDFGYINGDNPGVGKVTKENNNIFLETWGTWCSYAIWTKQRIDFSKYSKLSMEIYDINIINSGHQQAGILLSNGAGFVASSYGKLNDLCEYIELDVSKIESLYYCYCAVANGTSARIKNVWLEI